MSNDEKFQDIIYWMNEVDRRIIGLEGEVQRISQFTKLLQSNINELKEFRKGISIVLRGNEPSGE